MQDRCRGVRVRGWHQSQGFEEEPLVNNLVNIEPVAADTNSQVIAKVTNGQAEGVPRPGRGSP